MRYEFGPSEGSRVVSGDPVITIDSFSRDGANEVVHVTVPPADPAAPDRLTRVFAVYAPSGPTADETPEAYMNAPGRYVGAVPISDPSVTAALAISVVGVPAGAWFVQTILQFA